jgi:CheY-like chemotaxis protein
VPIRVLLAEDNALLRQGLERLIERDDDLDLVGSVADLPSLQKAIAEQQPDVVVSDIRMPPTGTDEGIQVAAQLRLERPEVGVVLLSQHADAAYALKLLEGGSGGRAYLLKERVGDVGELTAAVRAVAEGGTLAGTAPHAAIGTHHAAALYGAVVLVGGIEDDAENATRFAWIARAARGDGADSSAGLKTALVFWGGGDLAPGWLVDCLTEFSSRAINLTRIESRPRRVGLGSYMFFCDLEGAASNPEVAAAIAGLRSHCEVVRVLGSFPAYG